MNKKSNPLMLLVVALVVVLMVSGIIALASLALMVFWSGFVTPVFGLTLLSFSQAFCAMGLFVLLRLVFAVNASRR